MPWGPAAAIMVAVLGFVGAQILAGVVLGAISGFNSSPIKLLDTTTGQFYYVLLSDLSILLFVWLFLRKRKARPAQLGLGRKPTWKDAGYAALAYVAYYFIFFAVIIVVSSLTNIDLNQKQELGFSYLANNLDKIMALISLVILPPLVEEIVFRGFVFTGLRTKLTFVWATVITSLLFAAPHLLASSQGLLWIAGVDTLVLSFVLCYLREKTGALWAPMLVHCAKNAIAFTILLASIAAL